MSADRIAVYFVRRDLRIADNHILHIMSRFETGAERKYTHLLPVYVLPPDQVETSGLLNNGATSPYPPARSKNSGIWKCGLHRVKFLAESVWDMKERLEQMRSGLIIRVGRFHEVLESIHSHYSRDPKGPQISSVWIAKGFSSDEKREQKEVYATCTSLEIEYISFRDRKPFIDLRDTSMQSMRDVPDVLSVFLEQMEPLIEECRDSIEAPISLPPFPDHVPLPTQPNPFEIPGTLPELIRKLHEPVRLDFSFFNGLNFSGVTLAPASVGGETHGVQRLRYIVGQGIASRFHNQLNDMEERDECLKLSGYLSLGCITSRQIHEELWKLESGNGPEYEQTEGFGGGQNLGTRAVRLELLRRDFLLLCSRKYRCSLFDLEGSGPGRNPDIKWKSPDHEKASPRQTPCPLHVEGILVQLQVGATGYGLIDAIMRQLLCTGHVGIRSNMLIVNFLAKFAGIDWRMGAEWVASLTTDHDTSLQWYKWKHYAGVGPDPRGGEITLSPVHAAFELDPNGSFVRKWMPELRRLTRLSNLFQVATTSPELLLRLGLLGNVMVTNPVPSDTLDLGPTSQVKCGWLHPRIFVPGPQGFVILGPYPKFLRMRQEFLSIHPQYQQIIYPPAPSELPLLHPTPGHLWVPVPGTQESNPQYYLAPHPHALRAIRHTLAWFFRTIITLRVLLQRARMRAVRAQMSSQQGTQMLNARNGGPTLPNRDASRTVPDAPRAPRTMSVSTETPRAPQVTQILQAPRRTQSLADPESGLDVAQELRRATPLASPSAPQAPRTDTRTSQAHQAPLNAPRAPRADSRPSQAPRNAPSAPRTQVRPYQAPPNVPNAPRAYIQRSQMPQSAPVATIRPSQASRAPPDVPRAPRAGFEPTRAPRNAPRAPRADYQPYQAPQNAPRAPRTEYSFYQPYQPYQPYYQAYQAYQPYQAPRNAPNVPQAPRADLWPAQAPQMAPRAPRAMRTPPTTPPQSPQAFNDPRALRTPAPSSLVGEADISSRYGPQSLYSVPNDPAVPVPFGSFTFNGSATAQPVEGEPYYQTLRDYPLWRTSDPAINAYYIGPPEPEEVLRHGMILRFLDSLPPTPPNPSFPPDPPQLLRRTRRRRATRTSDDYGSSNQAEPSEEAMSTENTAQNNAESAQGRRGRRTRRGRRGRRGKGDGNGRKSDETEEVQGEKDS